ncbi:MAG: hypothetical protein ACFB2W_11775 [Leptolyngbyaceae cyanobacterium]
MALNLWRKLLQIVYSALDKAFERGQSVGFQSRLATHSSVLTYSSLEALPDYYFNCDSAKRLWQEWRVLRRLFIRRDHSRDLLFQGQSGWLPIHGMMVNRQTITITTDDGEKVLDVEERVVWLSRANPANTQITQESVESKMQWSHTGWCLA